MLDTVVSLASRVYGYSNEGSVNGDGKTDIEVLGGGERMEIG